jgi:uncharacterized radical SAM protein YgiQ
MKNRESFLPVTAADLRRLLVDSLDVILVTGDAYVDHPSYGTAVIGRVLEAAGFRTGVIAQPDWKKTEDFLRLGRPKLFFGVTGGNLDSLVANYTANKFPRREDEYSPGGRAGLRPDLATVVYTNRLKQLFPGVPVILGGVEASLRRLAHYSYWHDAVRRSILLDAKADLVIYGMGEKAAVETAQRLKRGESIQGIPGTVAAVKEEDVSRWNAAEIPSFEQCASDPAAFNDAFARWYAENDAQRGRPVLQRHGSRAVIQFPPAPPLSSAELDAVYELPYARAWHPDYERLGGVPGFRTTRFSMVSHRGCPGECSFCSLHAHQGRIVQSRSPESLVREAKTLASRPDFDGTITDIGGPTANLYAARCARWDTGRGACVGKNCMMPEPCAGLKLGYDAAVELWSRVMEVPGVKHVFISSGLRYDLLIQKEAEPYLRALCKNHVSGQLKVAPEHCHPGVLEAMGKPPFDAYEIFSKRFEEMNERLGKNQFLVNYFVSAHPGSGLKEALELALYLVKRRMNPEQVQDFIPLPMTVSSCMYHTGRHPMAGKKIHVSRDPQDRKLQRALLQHAQPQNRALVLEALRRLERRDLEKVFCGVQAAARRSSTRSGWGRRSGRSG